MEVTAALAARQQLFQAKLGMVLLRAQHQAQQTLINLLADSARAGVTANPAHLGRQVDTQG